MRLGVQQIAQQLNLTPRAVRLYDDLGLVQSHRDRQNWRRYDREACGRLALIARLRAAGPGLEEVREILSVQDAGLDAQREVALRHLTRRREELEQWRRAVDELTESFLSEPATASANAPEGSFRLIRSRPLRSMLS